MEITTSKLVSVAIAIGYAIAIVAKMGFTPHATIGLLLLVPLAFIWFPEEIGSYTGYVGRGNTIDTETPPFMVSGIGWLLLVLSGVPVVAISLSYQ
jgi:hypothetical protein